MMLPRKKLDIGWTDLLAGAAACIRPGNTHTGDVLRRIEVGWAGGKTLTCLSIRSGFDLLLQALAFPRGSEILLSAVTIWDMVRIVEEHGLVPVPIDLNMRSLSLDMDSLRHACSTRSRALVVAHLFGSRMPLDDIAAFAKARGLFLIEDCAQAFSGREYCGHIDCDASMFSFGPIKTNTALGGGLLQIKDAPLLHRTKLLQESYPEQKRGWFLKRILKFASVKLLLTRAGSTLFVAACRRMKRAPDEVLSAALRGFPGPDFFQNIRKRPGYSLLALLDRRLKNFQPSSLARRTATAEDAARMMPGITRPGSAASTHSHWVYPIQSSDPEALMRHLHDQSMDATRGASSLYVIDPPPNTAHRVPVEAMSVMRDVLYLPVYPEVPERLLKRMARVVVAFETAAQPLGCGASMLIDPVDGARASALS